MNKKIGLGLIVAILMFGVFTGEKCADVSQCIAKKQDIYMAANSGTPPFPIEVLKQFKHDCDCSVTGQAADGKPCI